MRRSETRYGGVWDAGYESASEDISHALFVLLRDGGAIQIRPFQAGKFVVRLGTGMIVETANLAALLPLGKRSE